MAGKIGAKVVPTTFVVAAGDTVEATATLRNLGQSVDQFTLTVERLDPGWYTLPVSSVALFPNDQDNLRIILHPPKTAETKAGSFPFFIKVSSQQNPEEIATVDLTIQVRELLGLELSISPPRVTGRRGIYRIEVNNRATGEATVRLEASDATGKLRYSLQPESLTVPGGGRAEATLGVRLRWLAIFGGEKKFDFQVVVTPAGLPEEAKTINGQLVRISLLAPLLARLFARPPIIVAFKATTEDRREFKLAWSAKRTTEVKLEGEAVALQGESLVHPTETTKYVLTASNRYGSTSQTIEVKPLPPLKAKVSGRIRASLSPISIQAQAGGVPVQTTLQMQNLGDIVDKFLVEIDGLDEAWYSRSASSVALMPQATDQVLILFQPPKKKGVRSKVYPFAVVVRSQTIPEEVTSIVGQLEVLPLVEFKLGVNPRRVSGRRKGTFRVNLANTGVTDTSFTLEATDLDEGLRFRFKGENPVVAAWDTVEVPMIAKPKRGSMIGEKKRYDITVTATTNDGKVQTVNCELNHAPLMSSWRPILRLIRAIIVLAILGVAIYFILRLGGGFGVLKSNPQAWVNQLIHTITSWFGR